MGCRQGQSTGTVVGILLCTNLLRKITLRDAAEIIDGIIETASKWPLIAKECEVPQKMIDAIIPEMK